MRAYVVLRLKAELTKRTIERIECSMTERHPTEEELVAGLADVRRSPADGGTLATIVLRPQTEQRELPESCQLTIEAGIPGDRWARSCNRRLPDGQLNPDTQLTLINTRFLALVAGASERWSSAGDNLLVDLDLSETNL